jgi:hypothetical protein
LRLSASVWFDNAAATKYTHKHPAVAGALVLQPAGPEAKKYQIRQALDLLVSNRLVET